MQSNEREIRGIIGLAGSGKSTLARALLKNRQRAIVLENGFTDETEFPGARAATLHDLVQHVAARVDRMFWVRYAAALDEFADVCHLARVAGALTLVIDEADRFLYMRDLPPEWIDLVQRGRHYGDGEGVSIMAITSDPMKIPIDLRRQFTVLDIFNTAEPADKKWLADLIGWEVAEKAAALKPGKYLEWVKGEGCEEKSITLGS